jgi:hypothetical protein
MAVEYGAEYNSDEREPSPPVLLHKKSLEACGAWTGRIGDTFVIKGEEVREYDL